jgi:YggT family protein
MPVRISGLVALLFQAYYLVVIVRVVFSWLRLPPRGVLTEHVGPLVYGLTEPLLRPIRKFLRPYQGGVPMDFSPLVLIVGLSLLETLILRALVTMGM